MGDCMHCAKKDAILAELIDAADQFRKDSLLAHVEDLFIMKRQHHRLAKAIGAAKQASGVHEEGSAGE